MHGTQAPQLKRRTLIGMLGGAAIAWPLGAYGQQPGKIHHIGILSPGQADNSDSMFKTLNAFVQGLHELGYVEGQNILIERAFAEWNPDRLRALAAGITARKLDVFVALSTTAALAAKEATAVLPIVAVAMADPIADGLVASLGRPGGNVTGTTFLGPELVARRLQLLREVMPAISRVAALWHPTAYSERTMQGLVKETETAARTLGLHLQLVPASAPDEIAGAFAEIKKRRPNALIVLPSPMLFGEYKRIVSIAAQDRLPAMGAAREFVDVGGLVSYGVNLPDLARQTAAYVDKILKGARPADLPVEQPTKFELVINLKAAKELGLTVSRDLLLVADDVVE
jgi:putative ABC transport system substrate-binding protein